MTPIDLIWWFVAIAIGIVIVGLALYLVAALYWGLQQARKKRG